MFGLVSVRLAAWLAPAHLHLNMRHSISVKLTEGVPYSKMGYMVEIYPRVIPQRFYPHKRLLRKIACKALSVQFSAFGGAWLVEATRRFMSRFQHITNSQLTKTQFPLFP